MSAETNADASRGAPLPGADSDAWAGSMTHQPLPPQTSLPMDKAWLAALARHQGALGPLTRVPGQLNEDCELYEGGHRVSSFGHRSTDGKHCEVARLVRVHKHGKVARTETRTERIPIGRTLYRDPQTGYVCTRARARGPQACPLAVSPEQNRPMTDAEQFGYGGAKRLVERGQRAVQAGQAIIETLTDPAKLETVAEHGKEAALRIADKTLEATRDPNRAKEAAADYLAERVRTARREVHDFRELPRGRQIEKAGGVILNGALDLVGGAMLGGVLRTGETAIEAADDARKLGRAAGHGRKAANAAEEAAEAAPRVPKGGTYVLQDDKSGQIMRTGRTKDHARRESEHRRDPETESLLYRRESVTDDYPTQRGLEQILHDQYKPPLNKIRPISPKNPNREKYLEAAQHHNEQNGLKD